LNEGPTALEITKAEAQIAQAEYNLAKAKETLERVMNFAPAVVSWGHDKKSISQ